MLENLDNTNIRGGATPHDRLKSFQGDANELEENSEDANSQVGVKPMNLLQQVRFINFIKRKGIKTQNTNRALIKLS